MIRLPLFATILALLSSLAWTAEDPFAKRTVTGADGATLPYRLLSPEHADAGKRYPLVIFLHGAGERGTDNEAQIKNCARDFAKPDVRAKFPCFVLAPQCPGDRKWCEVDWGDPKPHLTPKDPSVPMGLLLGLLPQVMKELPIDPSRVYVTGLSMGGFGTWDLITRLPNVFAAAAPICGGGDVTAAPALAKLPIWIFHGGNDGVVKTVRSQLMIEALKQAGSTVAKYSEYPGVGHDSWGRAFAEPEFFTWLFAQQRGDSKKK
jgi:predicted peptidase